MYRFGVGVAPDPGRAAKALFFEAALRGVPEARVALAAMFDHGIGVPHCPDGADPLDEPGCRGWLPIRHMRAWRPLSGGLGDRDSRTMPRHSRCSKRARRWATRIPMANLGQAYRDGRGVPMDIQQAVNWLERATELGDDRAPYHLAKIYHDGAAGIESDQARAKALLELAIDRGHDFSLYRLATYDEGGRDWPPDLEQSAYHLLLALEFSKAIRHPECPESRDAGGSEARSFKPKISDGALAAAQVRVTDWVEHNGLDSSLSVTAIETLHRLPSNRPISCPRIPYDRASVGCRPRVAGSVRSGFPVPCTRAGCSAPDGRRAPARCARDARYLAP